MDTNGGVMTPISGENDVGKIKGRNNKLPLTAPNSLNLFDLIKTGAMVTQNFWKRKRELCSYICNNLHIYV